MNHHTLFDLLLDALRLITLLVTLLLALFRFFALISRNSTVNKNKKKRLWSNPPDSDSRISNFRELLREYSFIRDNLLEELHEEEVSRLKLIYSEIKLFYEFFFVAYLKVSSADFLKGLGKKLLGISKSLYPKSKIK